MTRTANPSMRRFSTRPGNTIPDSYPPDAKSEADTSGSTCEDRELYTSTVSSFRHVRIFRHSIFVTDKQPHRLEPKSLAYLSLTDSFIALAQPLPSSTMNEMKSMQLVNACF